MKIAILELYCGQSGKAGYYNNQELGLAKAYERMGHAVYVVLPDRTGKQVDILGLTNNITIVHVPAKVIGVHSFYKLSFIKEWEIDLVHIDADNQIYASRVMKYCLKNRVKFYNYVGTVSSDTDSLIKSWLIGILCKANIKMYHKTPTFVKTTAVRQALACRGVKGVVVEPVGLDFEVIPVIKESKEELREKLHLPKEKNILLFIGRLEEYKKPAEAVRLLSEMDDRHILVMIGDGTQKEQVLQKIDELGLQGRVIYIARIPNVEIHQYYKAADCFINLNSKEIFGMSILESIYQGCPVVARHAPGPDIIIQQGVTGYLCNTLEEMANRIVKMDLLISEKIIERIREKFSWDNTAKGILNHLELH